MQVQLKGKSKKGKDRIRQHGPIWNVVREETWQGQPCLMLESLENTFSMGSGMMKTKDLRRVLKVNDPDFEIV